MGDVDIHVGAVDVAVVDIATKYNVLQGHTSFRWVVDVNVIVITAGVAAVETTIKHNALQSEGADEVQVGR